MKTLKTVSGRTKQIPDFPKEAEYPGQFTENDVKGLDQEGRIVVDMFHGKPADYLFGLTLCCNAFDKGVENGVVCRCCYGSEHGHYLWATEHGNFPKLDPVESIV